MPRTPARLGLVIVLAVGAATAQAESISAGAKVLASPVLPAPDLEITGSLPVSAPEMGDAPSVRVRPHGAFAPYLSNPPDIGISLDATAVMQSLEARGFSGVSRPVLRGRTYVCEATGPRRERVRLMVDAGTGVIVGLTVIGFDSSRD
ncbi:hypothetical protein [Azorhizobium caulinodans]|uniref:hypothetical protein n=1 Tax=Azorhizobium caulinodans TaxID=7 RepID=UPI002FBE913A